MLLERKMKGWSQSKNNTQLWVGLVIEARSNAVRSDIAYTLRKPKLYPIVHCSTIYNS